MHRVDVGNYWCQYGDTDREYSLLADWSDRIQTKSYKKVRENYGGGVDKHPEINEIEKWDMNDKEENKRILKMESHY